MNARRVVAMGVAAVAVGALVVFAPDQPSPADGCARENRRVVHGTVILLTRCTGAPDGRTQYGASITNGRKGDKVVLRYREAGQREIETVVAGSNGYAETGLHAGQPGELQACLRTDATKLDCALTFDDPES